MVLALDLGTSCGYAIGKNVLDIPTVIESGTWHHASKRYGQRFLNFWMNLTALQKAWPEVDGIVYEDVRRHLATDAGHVYGGFEAFLHAWAIQFKIPEIESVGVGVWKKNGLQIKGNADKLAVMRAVQAKKLEPKDFNEADAIGVLLWALLREQQQSTDDF